MKKFKKALLLIMVISLPFVVALVFSHSASAYDYSKGTNKMLDKIVAYQLPICINNLQESISMSQFDEFVDYVWDWDKLDKIFFRDQSARVAVPNFVFDGDASSSPKLSCFGLLFGQDSKWNGFYDPHYYIRNTSRGLDYQRVNTLLTELGYERNKDPYGVVDSEETASVCLKIKIRELDFNTNQITDQETNCLSAELYEDKAGDFGGGYIVIYDTLTADWSTLYSPGTTVVASDTFGIVDIFAGDASMNSRFCFTQYYVGGGQNGWSDGNCLSGNYQSDGIIYDVPNLVHIPWSEIVAGAQKVVDKYNKDHNGGGAYYKREYSLEIIGPNFSGGSSGGDEEPIAPVDSNTTYSKKASIGDMRKKITGLDKESEYLVHSIADTYNLYARYLNDRRYVSIVCDDNFSFPDNYYKVKIKVDGKVADNCYATENAKMLYNGMGINQNTYMVEGQPIIGYYWGDKDLTLKQIVDRINAMNIADILDELDEIGTVDNPLSPEEDPEPGGSSGSGDPCYSSSESLGWILCPVINKIGDTLESLYEWAIEPMLQIKSELFNNDNGVKEVWKIFRDIANIMFVILFLVVIFSQLTGVGIDNYGIKKILPKMIIAAVLINLSYVICQLAVDISNIAGAGLNGLLSSQASRISGWSGDFTSGVWFKHVLNVFLGVLTVGGAAGVIITVFGQTGALGGLILPLLMGLITAFVAVLFFFALLGMRQAGVLVLVAVSPVAFAFYMLPNTKKLFDKWLKIFEGLLLLYPICGLLVGGGALASAALTKNQTDFFVWFIGLLLMVVPFFFIPMLLKGSFAALGGIGAKISGFGKKFGKGLSSRAGKTVSSTDAYRRLDNAMGRLSFSRKRRAAAVSDTAAFKKEMGARRRLSDRGNMKTRIAAIEAAEEAKATDEATSQRLSLMMSSGEGGGITMADGSKATYTLDNAEKRVTELEKKSRTSALTSEEQLELSALARGMSSMKGGAGRLGRIIRNSQDGAGNANTNFMSAMGEIYARDSIVQSKMNEKDMGASVYTEHFMPGGAGVTRGSNGQLGFTQTHSSYSGTADYRGSVFGRVKSHAAGLNQGGDATTEYIESLSQEACQEIMDNQELLNSLDVDVRQQFLDYAAGRTGTIMKVNKDGSPVLDANGNQVPKWDYSSTHTGWSVTEPRAKTVQFGDGSKEMRALGGIEANTGMTASNTDRIATGTERIVVNTERTANGIDDVNASLQRHTRASMDAAAATLDNDTLMEIATNPQVKMDDPLREAAEREAKRRVQDGKMKP